MKMNNTTQDIGQRKTIAFTPKNRNGLNKILKQIDGIDTPGGTINAHSLINFFISKGVDYVTSNGVESIIQEIQFEETKKGEESTVSV